MSHKAWQNAHAMYENDACAKALGIDIISMDEGFAVVTMTVTAQMLNGHQSCHGGDAPRDKCTLSCAINGIHAAFHYLKKNYISGCVMTVPTG